MYVFFKLDLDQPGCGGYAGLSAISANSLTDQDISQGWPWSGTGALGTELSTGKPRGQGLEQVEMEHHNTNLNTNRQSVQICTFFDVYIFRFIKKKIPDFSLTGIQYEGQRTDVYYMSLNATPVFMVNFKLYIFFLVSILKRKNNEDILWVLCSCFSFSTALETTVFVWLV